MSPEDQASGIDALETMAARLEADADYRVLRRLERPTIRPVDAAPDELGAGLLVDVETTGLDQQNDEVIELAMIPFTFQKSDGAVIEIGEPFQGLQQPSGPLPQKVIDITGLTDADLAGQRLDMDAVRALADTADLIVAHNAGFDRPFLERLDPVFAEKHWACSMEDVDWTAEGFDGRGLKFLAMQSGFFFDGHRAANDCFAAIELLARPLPRGGDFGMARLLETARRKSRRLWAIDSPFDAKDMLKARGYRWNAEGPKAWFLDVGSGPEALSAEAAFLRESIYGGDAVVWLDTLTAKDRYSAQPPRARSEVALSKL